MNEESGNNVEMKKVNGIYSNEENDGGEEELKKGRRTVVRCETNVSETVDQTEDEIYSRRKFSSHGLITGKRTKKSLPKYLKRTIGILITLLNCFMMISTSLLIKEIPLPSTDIMPYIGVTACLSTSIIIFKVGVSAFGGRRTFLVLILRGVTAAIFGQLYFFAIKKIPLSDAVVIHSSSIGLIVILAWIILKERPGAVNLAAAAAMLCGVVLITRPAFIFRDSAAVDDETYPNRTLGGVMAVCAMVTSSMGVILTRKIGQAKPHWLAAATVTTWAIILIGFPLHIILNDGEIPAVPCGLTRYLVILAGLVFIVNCTLRTASFRFESATVVSAVGNVKIVLSFLAQYFILGETENSVLSFIGSGIIVSASLIITLKAGMFSEDDLWCKYC